MQGKGHLHLNAFFRRHRALRVHPGFQRGPPFLSDAGTFRDEVHARTVVHSGHRIVIEGCRVGATEATVIASAIVFGRTRLIVASRRVGASLGQGRQGERLNCRASIGVGHLQDVSARIQPFQVLVRLLIEPFPGPHVFVWKGASNHCHVNVALPIECSLRQDCRDHDGIRLFDRDRCAFHTANFVLRKQRILTGQKSVKHDACVVTDAVDAVLKVARASGCLHACRAVAVSKTRDVRHGCAQVDRHGRFHLHRFRHRACVGVDDRHIVSIWFKPFD